ncbi:transporter substrate-binding domain-containing protein [Pseudoruegeria sp. HB172150]|uniref:transporter substrate-binding domain-containing protein n=1 Tax=Pseudoruegeria sp. HB172150 TaxID=2721164 RepID=UPI0015526D6E|nr:transporter substrate-binding domain-containing protein [Pseudoruegeria sp. HB172150]
MRKLYAVLISAAVLLGLVGPVSAQSALNEILDSGVLKVGTTGDWNPMSVRDPATNSYKGFDIDVMNELASDLGVEVEFVPTDWKTLVNGVVAGNYNLTGSASILPARMKVAAFSNVYLEAVMYPFTTEDKEADFDGWDSINKSGVKVATTLGTSFEPLVKQWFPEAEITVIEAPARGYQEVLSGRADVFVTSNIEGSTLMENFPVVRVPNTDPRQPSQIAMLMAQDDQVWINYINTWIELKKRRGFFEDLKAKWKL